MSKCTHNILFLIFTLNLARFGDCLRISSGWAWDHKTCDGIGNHLVKVNRVKLNPDPLMLRGGNLASVQLDFVLQQQLNGDAKVDVELTRSAFFGSYPIPCQQLNGVRVGSCTYTVDELMRVVQKDIQACKKFIPNGGECKTPLLPGKYHGEIQLKIPELPNVMKRWGAGKYVLKVKAANSNGQQILCQSSKFQIKS